MSWMPKSSFPLCVTRILDYAKDLDFQPGKSTRLCKITAFSAYLASQTRKIVKILALQALCLFVPLSIPYLSLVFVLYCD